ncbi:unconventional myosin-Vb isoform X2 [Sitodiplosis mosellana]|uniref:unconventional myosin-Vb isoform X2 n=1 Tax=Sitodiplosis mosellana TaxID=263140 RepID=UPI002444B57D|nr:unconventional myosin-Vb isoform X2 [Sitodiplosis mosellana]
MAKRHTAYITGARVWIPNATTVWEGAQLVDDFHEGDKQLKICCDAGDERVIEIRTDNDLPLLRNPAILIGQNDLTALSYLHEPDVLHTLEVRFCDRQTIYTYCGIVLVAINPYAELPLYGPDIIRMYRGQTHQSLEPHIFAVAEEAYAKLEREKCDLSIIVSGESGAGKTVSAKYAMRYFAAVGGNEFETQIERKILASNPIMEAIGNAKTTRNDNSSRFGKFTKLLFTNRMNVMSLTGATMNTYLLEKSRVVFQAPGERNYHIFYQLCAARDQWPELMLDHQQTFRYLNQGNTPNINRVSDLDQFSETVAALDTLGFTAGDVDDIVKTCAAILHLGNVNIAPHKRNSKEADQEECDISSDDLHLNLFADIMQVDREQLRKWLITRQIESINEHVLIPMNQIAAETARDALAKHIYAKLFTHIVNIVNKNLESGHKQHCFIGVLDIYGFETFDINSFEQFCINYANEKLQQQFNQHIFKLEQEQYLSEGIDWTMIDFYDNQPCIELIESKLGILDLLDEECRVPRGSDESWVGKLNEKCAKYKHFERARFGNASFVIKHFSDTVQYQSTGFLEKNRDTISKELVNVMRESNLPICRTLIALEERTSSHGKETSLDGRVKINAAKHLVQPSKQHKHTVGTQFRDSLTKLISTLHATTPHYVRCIKPNDDKVAFKWECQKIVQQLRACGVLETVRISAAGFPSRWTYENFFSRYFLLCKLSQSSDDERGSCAHIVQNYITDEDKYRFGHTQIFFRAGQVALLEQIRTDLRKRYIILVQSMVRRFIARKKFLRNKQLALGLQRYCRGYLARCKAQSIRRERAVVVVQRRVRGWLCRVKYQRVLSSVLLIQTYGRGLLARRLFAVQMDNYKATVIQRYCRGYLARKAFTERKRKIIIGQSAIRRFLARRQFKKLKAEARTITHMQKMYKGLENKIISLQQRIDELTKSNQQLSKQAAEVPELHTKLEAKKQIEDEFNKFKAHAQILENQVETLNKQLDEERDEKLAALDEKAKEEAEFKQKFFAISAENEHLNRKIEELQENQKEVASAERSQVLSDLDDNEIHQAYQKIAQEKEQLEKENFLLSQEVDRLSRLQPNSYLSHSRSVSNVSSVNIDEDFGYASAKNTLELKKDKDSAQNGLPEKEKLKHIANDANHSPDGYEGFNASTPKRNEILTILKMKNVLQDEIKKRKSFEKQLQRSQDKLSSLNVNTEDAIRVSELEIENEKLHKDLLLLRNSIDRGIAEKELEAQFLALEEENKRRRDECIQLRSILAQRSHGSPSKMNGHANNVDHSDDYKLHESELLQAFEAQKVVNRQLESELTALTEENNSKMLDMSKEIEELRSERNQFQEIMHNQIRSTELSEEYHSIISQDNNSAVQKQQNVDYLMAEIRSISAAYTQVLEENSRMSKSIEKLMQENQILSKRLRQNGIDDSIVPSESLENSPMIHKRAPTFQGIFKYRAEDVLKLLQRVVDDLEPRVAKTLTPALPAYIIFMCIRYTDIVNDDDQVRKLLTSFISGVKNLYRTRHDKYTTEHRTMWLVNMIKLLNLLKQYGGLEEYMKFNTLTQNEQQLKNFDLSEYRQVIFSTIIVSHQQIIQQIQEIIKVHIVPAILDYDEMARGKQKGKRVSGVFYEPRSLVNQLDHFYELFKTFGLDDIFIDQIFKQFFYYICAISLNNLMLRRELCMWKTGMRIRYNISCLEEWARKMKMSNEITEPLTPLIQVASLLQARKETDQDVQVILDICSTLSTAQVIKILKSYTLDDCEAPIKPAFIEKLTTKLNERPMKTPTDTFTIDEAFVHPLKVVYKYDDTRLEEIDLPQILNLNQILTKI